MSAFDSERDLSGFSRETEDLFAELDGVARKCEESSRDFVAKRSTLEEAFDEYRTYPSAEKKEKCDAIAASTKKAKEIVERDREKLASSIGAVATSARVSRKEVVSKLMIFHDKKEDDRIMRILQLAQTIDLCFVIDATGSMHMDNVFEALKKHIRTILQMMKENNPAMDFQLSIIAYRDPEDGPARHLEVLPFTTSRTEFEAFVAGVKCGGGGDQCEDVLGGLKEASELSWKFYNRILFLCGDAPCHGSEYHSGCFDNHPHGLPGRCSADIMRKLVDLNVQMYFWKINSSTDKMIQKLNMEARSAPGNFPLDRSRDEFIVTTPIDISSASSIIGTIKDSITASMRASMSSSMSRAGAVKPRELKSTLPFMEKIAEGEEESRDESLAKDLLKKASLTPDASLVTPEGKKI